MSTPTAIKTPDVEVEKTAQTNGEAEESVHVKDLQKYRTISHSFKGSS